MISQEKNASPPWKDGSPDSGASTFCMKYSPPMVKRAGPVVHLEPDHRAAIGGKLPGIDDITAPPRRPAAHFSRSFPLFTLPYRPLTPRWSRFPPVGDITGTQATRPATWFS